MPPQMSVSKGDLLQDTWESVLHKLALCVSLLRTRKDYENCVITVCLSAGENFDTFTIPQREWGHGIAGAILRSLDDTMGRTASKTHDLFACTEPYVSLASCKEAVEPSHAGRLKEKSVGQKICSYREFIEEMNMADLKRFLSCIRARLKLRSFVWPDKARDVFKTNSSEPIPGAPGRTNSRKGSLIAMLDICMKVDTVWREAIIAEVNSLARSRTLSCSNYQQDVSPKVSTKSRVETPEYGSQAEVICIPRITSLPLKRPFQCSSSQGPSELGVDVAETENMTRSFGAFVNSNGVVRANNQEMQAMRERVAKRDDLIREVENIPFDNLQTSIPKRDWLNLR